MTGTAVIPVDSRQVTVAQDDATTVTIVLARQVPAATRVPLTAAPSATSMAVHTLPKTGHGDTPGSGLPWLLPGLSGLACVAGVAMSRQTRRHD
ncbi:MAG: hypothetical protein QM753_20630 [Thermomicrobiales bacterium]